MTDADVRPHAPSPPALASGPPDPPPSDAASTVPPRAAIGRLRRSRPQEPGDEPDARFSFANERTFLAWNRTALGCVVAGLAVSHILPEGGTSDGVAIPAGVVLMAVGAVIALVSHGTWAEAQRALRLRLPLPRSPLPRLLSLATALVAVVSVVATVT